MRRYNLLTKREHGHMIDDLLGAGAISLMAFAALGLYQSYRYEEGLSLKQKPAEPTKKSQEEPAPPPELPYELTPTQFAKLSPMVQRFMISSLVSLNKVAIVHGGKVDVLGLAPSSEELRREIASLLQRPEVQQIREVKGAEFFTPAMTYTQIWFRLG